MIVGNGWLLKMIVGMVSSQMEEGAFNALIESSITYAKVSSHQI